MGMLITLKGRGPRWKSGGKRTRRGSR